MRVNKVHAENLEAAYDLNVSLGNVDRNRILDIVRPVSQIIQPCDESTPFNSSYADEHSSETIFPTLLLNLEP